MSEEEGTMMDLTRFEELMLRHRHGDGTWGTLEPKPHHDPASHDDERTWEQGRHYVCSTCDEEVHVVIRSDPPPEG
jgi:hypothetical protein